MILNEEVDEFVTVILECCHNIVMNKLCVIKVVEATEIHGYFVVESQVPVPINDVFSIQGFVEGLDRQSQLLDVGIHGHLAESVVEMISHFVALIIS
jgi:hypothetical protein